MRTSTSTSKPTLELYGVLGCDPFQRFTRARTTTKKVYERGVLVEKQVPIPPRPYWKLQLGLLDGSATDWIDCVIWNTDHPDVQDAGEALNDDRVVVTGHYETYPSLSDGRTVSRTHFVVESCFKVG